MREFKKGDPVIYVGAELKGRTGEVQSIIHASRTDKRKTEDTVEALVHFVNGPALTSVKVPVADLILDRGCGPLEAGQYPPPPLRSVQGVQIILDMADEHLTDWEDDAQQGGSKYDRDFSAERRGQFDVLKPFILLAVEAFSGPGVELVQAQLASIRKALDDAHQTLKVAGETHPDQGQDCDSACAHGEGGIAGACAAGARECEEALHFLDKLAARFPTALRIPPLFSVDQATGEVELVPEDQGGAS